MSEGQLMNLPIFDNDLNCGLTVEEIKSQMTAFSFGTLEFPLDPEAITPVGEFDLNNLQYRTNVTTDYFESHPDAYVRGSVFLQYKVSDTETKKSLIQIRIVK